MEQLASINVTRPRAWVGAIRKFRILCDGVEIAQISNDSTSQIQLAAAHTPSKSNATGSVARRSKSRSNPERPVTWFAGVQTMSSSCS